MHEVLREGLSVGRGQGGRRRRTKNLVTSCQVDAEDESIAFITSLGEALERWSGEAEMKS